MHVFIVTISDAQEGCGCFESYVDSVHATEESCSKRVQQLESKYEHEIFDDKVKVNSNCEFVHGS